MKGFMTARFLWLAAAAAIGGIFALGVPRSSLSGRAAVELARNGQGRPPQIARGAGAMAVDAGEFSGDHRVRIIRDGRGRIRQVRDEGGVTISLTYSRDGSLERREVSVGR